MCVLLDFSLFSDQRTELAVPSLLACAQKTQTPLWGAWCPWLLLPSNPTSTRAPTLWVGADIKPCLMERKVCTLRGMKAPVSPREVPGSVKFMGWNHLHRGDKSLLPALFRTAYPSTFPNLDPVNSKQSLCKGMCSAHFRAFSAQRAGSEVTGILPLASTLFDQNLRKVFSACSPGTPVDMPKESANSTWKIQVHVTKFKSTCAVATEKNVGHARLKWLLFRS